MASAVYNANYRSRNTRTHGRPDAFQFGAATDSAAAAISAAVVAAKGIYGKQVSLYKQLYREAYGSSHPAGTVYSGKVFLSDGVNKVQRINSRNVLGTVGEKDLAALFMVSTAWLTSSGYANPLGLAVMSGPAIILPSAVVAVIANADIIAKH